MGKIKQTYAWSESRVKCLRECAWKYYLTYCCAWEGWLASAPQEKRRAYMLKNMTNMPMFVGSIVHEIIENIITIGRKTKNWGSIEKAQHDAVQALRKGWKQSKEKRWQGSPKQNINLAEHFYSEEIDKDKLNLFKQKVLVSLKAFYDMPLFRVLQGLAEDDWLSLEDFQKFQFKTGEEVAVKIDCGFRYCDKIYLLDWKTGKVSNSVIDQLITYSMYAIKQKWTQKPNDIVIIPVYLSAYSQMGEQATPHLKVTINHMKRQASIIREEYPLLAMAFDNRNNPKFFKRTDNERTCQQCFFREMCDGAKTEIDADETPF